MNTQGLGARINTIMQVAFFKISNIMPLDKAVDAIKKAIVQGVNELISKFNKNPYAYLYESDLQCELFGILRRATDSFGYVEVYGKQLALINTECKRRIDVACLDPVRCKQVKPINNVDELWNLPLLFGIELKYVTGGYLRTHGPNVHESDIGKLQGLRKEEDGEFQTAARSGAEVDDDAEWFLTALKLFNIEKEREKEFRK